ncbi:hypothetical protein [Clostridium saccharoperbutylacetonicum]|uniref:hypothetical protein n=1 Tax=Clostridium saccharoperbutylacetonicum TaxID=36745 RepID=UPI0039E8A5C0
MKLNIRQFEQKAAAVSSLVDDVMNALPDSELSEDLRNNFDELHSMILTSIEVHDYSASYIEK